MQKKQIKNCFKNLIKLLIFHLPLVILILLNIHCLLNLNAADSKILSSYDAENETILIYNGLPNEIDNITITINLKQDSSEKIAISSTVPHLSGYKEKEISISDKLPHGFNVRVTKVTVKAFKVDYFNFIGVIITLGISILYYRKFRKHLLF